MHEDTLTLIKLAQVISNEPLIEPVPTLVHLPPTILNSHGRSLYYGTGLTTPRALSIGLPFDTLGMALVANKLRQLLGLKTIIHHIADTHALSNTFATREAVDALADSAEAVMQKVAQHLKIPDFRVVRSSSFDTQDEYQQLLGTIHTAKGEYVQRELADMLWYRAKHGLSVKMGWIIQSTAAPEGFDERLYDAEYRQAFGDDIAFMYLKAGRTFDQKRPKASPYISVSGEQRILLQKGEDVQGKFTAAMQVWPDKQLGGAVSHLNNIVRLYERTVGSVGKGPLPEKIQRIIDAIFA